MNELFGLNKPLEFVTIEGYATILEYTIKKFLAGLDWQQVYNSLYKAFYISETLITYFVDEGLANAKVLVEQFEENQKTK